MKGFEISHKSKIYAYNGPVNMSASFPKLTELVVTKMGHHVGDGDLFLFVNRKMNYLKILYYQKGGFCIFAKRLTMGRFQVTDSDRLSMTMLNQLVDNVVIDNKRKHILKAA